MIVNKDLELAREKQRRMVAEANLEKVTAKLEYVAMMTDIDIDEEEADNAQQDV